MNGKENLSAALYRLMLREGYPADFAAGVAREMNTEYLAQRMLRYVSRVGLIPPEEFADEMLAVIEERDHFRGKLRAEEAQAKINEMLLYGLNTGDEEE